MRLIVEIDLSPVEGHTMTERKLKAVRPRLEALMAQDRDLLKALVKEALDQILQAEMTEFLGAAPGERNATRAGYRAGYYVFHTRLPAPNWLNVKQFLWVA